MNHIDVSGLDVDGPDAADLAEIEDEWPLIAAELAVLDAEIAVLYAADRGGPSVLDWRRLRRAEARVTRAAAGYASRSLATPVSAEPVGVPGGHVCDLVMDLVEHAMSECVFGCKVYRCRRCDRRLVGHSAVYGCTAVTADPAVGARGWAGVPRGRRAG